MHSVTHQTIYKIIIWQAVLVLSLSALLGWIFTFKTAFSFTLGGMISILPGWLFAKIVLKKENADKTAKQVVHSFFYAEVLKWLAAIVLFILAFQWKGLQIIPLFLGIIAAQLVYWVALLKSS